MHAAWTESMLTFDLEAAPVTLVDRRRFASSAFVLDRALTSALALPVDRARDRGEPVDQRVRPRSRSATRTSGPGRSCAGRARSSSTAGSPGYAVAPRGGRDLLLGGPGGLRWFRVPRRRDDDASRSRPTDDGDSVLLSGHVGGVASGTVTIYRERPGEPRTAIGHAPINGGEYSFVDRPPQRPLVYRAVYTDAKTGVPVRRAAAQADPRSVSRRCRRSRRARAARSGARSGRRSAAAAGRGRTAPASASPRRRTTGSSTSCSRGPYRRLSWRSV